MAAGDLPVEDRRSRVVNGPSPQQIDAMWNW
jgi:hypothetical protein